jgi:hypothetical protein
MTARYYKNWRLDICENCNHKTLITVLITGGSTGSLSYLPNTGSHICNSLILSWLISSLTSSRIVSVPPWKMGNNNNRQAKVNHKVLPSLIPTQGFRSPLATYLSFPHLVWHVYALTNLSALLVFNSTSKQLTTRGPIAVEPTPKILAKAVKTFRLPQG